MNSSPEKETSINAHFPTISDPTVDGGTSEFFGPLTLVNQRIWPRLELRPEVYRLRVLNGSNARAYRLHFVAIDEKARTVTPQHDRLLVIGTEGGLLRRRVRWTTAAL